MNIEIFIRYNVPENLAKANITHLSPKVDVNFKYFEDAYYEKRVWAPSANISNYVMIFTHYYLGSKDAIGRKSFKNLIVTLSESEIVPKVLVFWNHAARACLDGSSLVPVLHKIEQAGVKVLVSGFFLEKFNLKDRLRVGKLANNFDLLAAIHKAQKVVSF